MQWTKKCSGKIGKREEGVAVRRGGGGGGGGGLNIEKKQHFTIFFFLHLSCGFHFGFVNESVCIRTILLKSMKRSFSQRARAAFQ